jgi:ABC-type branched-subunit amino acid transport system ATPase component
LPSYVTCTGVPRFHARIGCVAMRLSSTFFTSPMRIDSLRLQYRTTHAFLLQASERNDKSQRRNIVATAAYRLDQVGPWEYRNELVKNLPYSKQRYLEITCALATVSHLLILDESSSGLNDRKSEDILQT